MSRRNIITSLTAASSLLTTLCLLLAITMAQKGPNAVSGVPIRGIDVKLGKNPGGSAEARAGTTDKNGQVTFDGLTPGNYSVTIRDPRPINTSTGIQVRSSQAAPKADAVTAESYEVEIIGAVGGPIKRIWNVKEGKFATESNAMARTTATHYTDTIGFEIRNPTCTMIVKSKSNITNNNRLAGPSPTPR